MISLARSASVLGREGKEAVAVAVAEAAIILHGASEQKKHGKCAPWHGQCFTTLFARTPRRHHATARASSGGSAE
eukprot:4331877-Amphidinium_carterae.1